MSKKKKIIWLSIAFLVFALLAFKMLMYFIKTEYYVYGIVRFVLALLWSIMEFISIYFIKEDHDKSVKYGKIAFWVFVALIVVKGTRNELRV